MFEIISIILAFITIILNVLDMLNKINLSNSFYLYTLDNIINIYFITEYIVRLNLAKNKIEFIKENKLDLIAIIPFNSLFKVFRVLKIFRIIKLFKMIKLIALFRRFTKRASKFLYTNGFINLLYVSIALVFLGAVLIYIVEKNITINSFEDAIWWSFVTTTTVGYGDLSPQTTAGRIIASFLMIIGIGVIGAFTGTIATFFIKSEDVEKTQENNSDLLKYIQNTNELKEDDKKTLIDFVNYLKNK